MTSKFDTNVKNYTTEQLMEFVGLTPDDLSNKQTIINQTNHFMAKYPKVANFGQEIQNTMLQVADQLASGNTATTPAANLQQNNWFKTDALTQNDEAQNEKITNRFQKIDVYGNQHVPMNREHLGVNNSFVLPVAQDGKLNPNLRTTTQRIVNLDSQFRTPANGQTATNYTCNLRDTIANAYSMRLYSFQIPYTWYAIDTAYGNTCFWIVDNGTYIGISITPGNYADATFNTVISTALVAAGFTFTTTPAVTYSANTGKLTFNLYGGVFSGTDIYGASTSFTISETTQIFFFDFSGIITCGNSCTNRGHYLNSTLGWIMGFRTPYVYVSANGNAAPAVMDLNGPKYLLLAIDDYCQNHVNHGLVGIDQPDKHFKLPDYYTPNMPYTCIPAASGTATGLDTIMEEVEADGIVTDTEGLLIGSKYAADYVATQQVLPSAPRVLTLPQIYTINEMNKLNNNNVNYLASSPSSSDILSLLPVKVNGLNVSDMIIEFSGSLQDNIRNYFGPVNIKRLGIKLMDDKGNILNLNGADWNVTIIFDCLYQY